jgi:sortase A
MSFRTARDKTRKRSWLVVSGLEWLFLISGLVAIDTYVWINTSTLLYQSYADWAFDQRLRGLGPSLLGFTRAEIHALAGREQTKPESTEMPAPPAKRKSSEETMPLTIKPPAPFEIIGRLEIPNLHLTAMVREGADAGTLRRAVGHIPGTALPGQKGNVGLAGHRDTFFRALRNVQKDDSIELETANGTYRYVVESTKIVGPRDVQVLASSSQKMLTLVTCYPFYYVGSAPKRFIVRAGLASVLQRGELTRSY